MNPGSGLLNEAEKSLLPLRSHPLPSPPPSFVHSLIHSCPLQLQAGAREGERGQ